MVCLPLLSAALRWHFSVIYLMHVGQRVCIHITHYCYLYIPHTKHPAEAFFSGLKYVFINFMCISTIIAYWVLSGANTLSALPSILCPEHNYAWAYW